MTNGLLELELWHFCSLFVHDLFSICSLFVHYLFIICSLFVHYLFIICSLFHNSFIICSLFFDYLFIIRSLFVHSLFIICYVLFIICLLFVHYFSETASIWGSIIVYLTFLNHGIFGFLHHGLSSKSRAIFEGRYLSQSSRLQGLREHALWNRAYALRTTEHGLSSVIHFVWSLELFLLFLFNW